MDDEWPKYMRMANFQVNAQIKDFSKMANREFTKSTKFISANGQSKFNFELTITPIWNRSSPNMELALTLIGPDRFFLN